MRSPRVREPAIVDVSPIVPIVGGAKLKSNVGRLGGCVVCALTKFEVELVAGKRFEVGAWNALVKGLLVEGVKAVVDGASDGGACAG